MSSQSKKAGKKIIEQRITTVVQVLSIMENEARQMSWFQRLKISHQFLWKKNINCFFGLAQKNKRKADETVQAD